MTDKEKKATDDLFSLTHINGYINLYDQKKANIYTSDLKRWQNGVKVLLNLIETQQEEIERLECNNEILQGELDRIGVKTLKLEKGSSTDDVIAEIEKLSNNNKDLLRKLRNRVKEVKKLTKYSLYKKEFATLNKQIEKKDKIINNSINEIEKIRQYFSEDLQVEFIRILEILKDKKVIDW